LVLIFILDQSFAVTPVRMNGQTSAVLFMAVITARPLGATTMGTHDMGKITKSSGCVFTDLGIERPSDAELDAAISNSDPGDIDAVEAVIKKRLAAPELAHGDIDDLLQGLDAMANAEAWLDPEILPAAATTIRNLQAELSALRTDLTSLKASETDAIDRAERLREALDDCKELFFELSNQLGGYVYIDTPERECQFIIRMSEKAAEFANTAIAALDQKEQ
jgi:hypothetical protein